MAANLESGKETQLALPLSTTDTEATLFSVPTKTSGRLFITDGIQRERVSYTGITGSKVTWLTRNLSVTWDPATGGTWLAFIAGSTVRLVAMHDQIVDKTDSNTYKAGTTQTFDIVVAKTVKFTGTTTPWLQPIALTTTQRDALDMTWVTASIIYNTTTTTYQQYIGGTWTDIAISAASPMLLTGDQTASGIKTFSSLLKATNKLQVWGETEVIDLITMWSSFRYGMGVESGWILRIFRHPAWAWISFWSWDGTTHTEFARISDWSTFTFDGGNIRRGASDAEALAGSSTTTVITPYQGTLISKQEVQTFTRNTTGTQTITHSLWKVPKMISVKAYGDLNASTWHINDSQWSYDWTNQYCVYSTVNAWAVSSSTTNKAIYITQVVSGTAYELIGTIQNVTSSSFDIVWTNSLGNSYVQQVKGIIEIA